MHSAALTTQLREVNPLTNAAPGNPESSFPPSLGNFWGSLFFAWDVNGSIWMSGLMGSENLSRAAGFDEMPAFWPRAVSSGNARQDWSTIPFPTAKIRNGCIKRVCLPMMQRRVFPVRDTGKSGIQPRRNRLER